MTTRPASSLLALMRRLQALPIIGPSPQTAVPPVQAPCPVPDMPADPATPAPDFLPLNSVSSVSNTQAPRAVGPAGIALIKRFEGCARLRRDGWVEAYPDPASGGEPWTIGWGATGRDGFNGGRIGPGTRWTMAQCDARLAQDLARFAAEVAAAIGTAPTTRNQFDALVSFHYNTGAIARARLAARHIAGDHAGAAREFARWNRAAGRVRKGLVHRRAAEAELYLSRA